MVSRLSAVFGVFAILALAAPAAAQGADVLAPARDGQLQCFEPNAAQKTCQSIGGYRFDADGVIQNAADVLIMPDPVIIMRVISPVTVRNGAICGPLRAEDINRANFTINGQRASETDTTQIRAQLAQQMAPILNVESCITLTPVDGGFRADTAMNGTPRPDLAQRVIWIRPEDRYRVAP